MMRFRYIDIPRLVFQLLRSNYAVRYDYDEVEQPQATTNLYRICLSMLYTLNKNLQAYYEIRSKQYMIAACTPTYGQIERVLNALYGYENDIFITPSDAQVTNSYWYVDPTPAKYLYSTGTPPVYLGQGYNYSESPIVNIPLSLFNDASRYSQFIADLNKLVPFFLTYIIRTY